MSSELVPQLKLEQLDVEDCGGLQDFVDSTVPSAELLEPETEALRLLTFMSLIL